MSNAYNCLPPEQTLFTYDSDTGDILPFGDGGVLGSYQDDDDDL